MEVPKEQNTALGEAQYPLFKVDSANKLLSYSIFLLFNKLSAITVIPDYHKANISGHGLK